MRYCYSGDELKETLKYIRLHDKPMAVLKTLVGDDSDYTWWGAAVLIYRDGKYGFIVRKTNKATGYHTYKNMIADSLSALWDKVKTKTSFPWPPLESSAWAHLPPGPNRFLKEEI